jgi:glycosyltransferase involved in cell wall biosynthesis
VRVPTSRSILLFRPEVPGVRTGNRLASLRWAQLWRQLGHRVRIRPVDDGGPADLVVALHAEKCAAPLLAALARLPRTRSLLVLGGTDWLGPEAGPRPGLSAAAERVLGAVDRVVVRQVYQGDGLPDSVAARTVLIEPSAAPVGPRAQGEELRDEVLSLAHLRAVKEPFLLAEAMALLPQEVALTALHLGAALDDDVRAAAERVMQRELRWRWLGPWPRAAARQRLRTARGLVLASRSEGAPGAVVEAIVQHVPVLASDIAAHRGLLGADWPGLFPVGDAFALARLLQRLVDDRAWAAGLEALAAKLGERFRPSRERADWAALFAELGVG